MSTYDDLEKALASPETPERLTGTIGAYVDGAFRVFANTAKTRAYVRLSKGGFVRARLEKVSPEPGLPVELMRDPQMLDEYIIIGPNWREIDAWVGTSGRGAFNVPFHTHERFSSMQYDIDDRLWAKLKTRIVSGLVVEVTEGRYDYNGAPRWWSGSTFDLTAKRPATVGHHAWCVININPTAGILSATTGVSQTTLMPLLKSQVFDVGQSWQSLIPVCAVKLKNGQISLTEYDFMSLLQVSGSAGFDVTAFDRVLVDEVGEVFVDELGRILLGE